MCEKEERRISLNMQTEEKDDRQAESLRELYDFLEVKRDYTN
jgi:hypothetical protein